jgi:hypothetical protein
MNELYEEGGLVIHYMPFLEDQIPGFVFSTFLSSTVSVDAGPTGFSNDVTTSRGP